MRFVDRNAVPAPPSLVDADGAGASELVEARAYYAADPKPDKAFVFKAYSGDDVKQALRTLFHGKCAYCESRFAATQPPDIEHYRPKGGIQENALHPGYWWLAMAWSNLLPTCVDCNRRRAQITISPGMTLAELEAAFQELGDVAPSGKQNAFPTLNATWADPEDDPDAFEQPSLINPTRDDPEQHLLWSTEVLSEVLSVVVPVLDGQGLECSRARASIFIYGLNRIGLVQARTEVLRGLQAQIESIRDLMDAAVEATPDNKEKALARVDRAVRKLRTFCESKSKYSAMANALVRKFELELTDWLAAWAAVNG